MGKQQLQDLHLRLVELLPLYSKSDSNILISFVERSQPKVPTGRHLCGVVLHHLVGECAAAEPTISTRVGRLKLEFGS
jgi:hypothetical protein